MKCFQCSRKSGKDDGVLTIGRVDIIVTTEEYNTLKFKSHADNFPPLGKQGESIVTICGKCYLDRLDYVVYHWKGA